MQAPGDHLVVRVIIATDGSSLAVGAAWRGRDVLRPDAEYVLAAAFPPEEYDGTGFAGPTVPPEEADDLEREHALDAESALTETATALELTGAEHRVLAGEPGPELCRLAEELKADVIVIGSHAWGPIKRALVGSVSDYVVRHAPCAVLVVNQEAAGDA